MKVTASSRLAAAKEKRGKSGLPDQVERDKIDSEVLLLDINSIAPNSEQPRVSFDEDYIKNLAGTIKDRGLIQPITVFKTDKGYELVAGENRLRAHKLLDLKQIRAIVTKSSPEDKALDALIENIHRDDLHPIEVGRGIANLIQKGIVKNQKEAKEKLNMSKNAISRYVSSANISDDAYMLSLDKQYKNINVFAALSKVEPTEQRELLAFIISEGFKENDAILEIKQHLSQTIVNRSVTHFKKSRDVTTINIRGLDLEKKNQVQLYLEKIRKILE
jgi:ParB family transcriptional regulator, chromosome partitioning protein